MNEALGVVFRQIRLVEVEPQRKLPKPAGFKVLESANSRTRHSRQSVTRIVKFGLRTAKLVKNPSPGRRQTKNQGIKCNPAGQQH
jgi:hypothetical protein